MAVAVVVAVVVEEEGGWLAGSGHMRENKFLPHCHGDESTAGRGGGAERAVGCGAQADLL